MQKHTNVTSGRIKQFGQFLEQQIITERAPLAIEFCDVDHPSEKVARKSGPWTVVQKGFKYGPAYRTFWFKVTGEVPSSMVGKTVGVMLEVGGERTLWADDSPVWGVDEPHPIVPFLEHASGNEKVDLVVQSYTRNPQCRVHLAELPREELVEEVEKAELVAIDSELKALWFDVDFAYNLLQSLEEKDPSYAVLMRALNEVCNLWARQGRDCIGKARRMIKEAQSNLSGELKHTVYPLGHAHLDTAWLWPLQITHKKMAHTTATQLQLISKYPEYIYVHSQASQYEWLEEEYPSLYKRVKAAIDAGQWEPVGSMWVEADCNLTGSESLVRQFLYGRRYFKDKLGVTTDDMFLPDVFGYSAALPQILSKFGIKYFTTQKISWNQFNKFPHNTFWWHGIDGSKVWTHFPPADTYIGSCEPAQIMQSVKNHRDHSRSDASLYLFGWGDGGGGPTERHLEFLRRARTTSNMPEIAEKRKAIDFYRDAYQKSKDLANWMGELYFEYHRGTYTSQAANKKNNRYCEFLLRDAELLSCFRDDYPKAYPGKELEKAWKLVLLNQFHDIIPGSSVREVYEDSDRDYAIIKEIGERLATEALLKIGAKLDTSSMERPVVIFQNADMPGIARMDWTEAEAPQSIDVDGDSYPVQVVESFGNRELVFATPYGALGSATVGDLRDEPAGNKFRLKASNSNRKIENAFFSLRFDSQGNIQSIESLEDGTNFLAEGKLANMFQIFDDKPLFWSAWDVDAYALETGQDLHRSERFEIVERGPVRVAAEIEKRFGKSRITQRIVLTPLPIIFFETEIDWHEEDKMLKVAFPVNVNSTRATYEIQFGNVERPTHSNTSWDMARFEVCAQKWVDLSEGDHGVALLNDGKYGHDIQGNVMRLTLLRSPKAPDPQCDMGVHRFTYALMPHFGPYNYAGVVQAAYALNAKTWVLPLEKREGSQGELPQFISCEDRNVVIESVKKAEDGNGIIVRLYECHNARGQAELMCARTIRSATLCNLEEVPEGELEMNEGAVLFNYKPFEILTIRLDI